MKKTTSNLMICAMVFAVALVIANVVTAKTVQTGVPLFGSTILVPSAVVCYCITFLMTDVVGEIWGPKEARTIVLGGFACADRFGRIEFRKYGSSPVCEIPETLRFSADLSEYACAVTALTYTDDYGRDTAVNFPKSTPVNTELNLHFTGNNFFFGEGSFQSQGIFVNYHRVVFAGQ